MINDDDIEDGEISDSDYTPLPRPEALLNATRVPMTRDLSSDDKDDSDQSDDSDGPKKPKVPRCRPKPRASVPAKFTVWSQDLQESELNEKLVNCDVELKYDKSRDVESYDYVTHREGGDTLVHKEPRVNVHNRLGERPEDENTTQRHLLELKVTESNTDMEIAINIANNLCEEKEELISRVVEVLGKESSIHFFNKTKTIEASGGMLIMNGLRRRTPGGVFLFLVRNEGNLTREQNNKIFSEDQQMLNHRKRKERAKKSRARCNEMKADLADQTTNALPTLPTRAELVLQQAADGTALDIACSTEETANPHPSEETRKLTAYEDNDFLDLATDDDIELF